MEDSGGKKKTWKHVTLSDLSRVAQEIISFAGDHTIWVFKGEMGAGKTTMIKEFGIHFGLVDPVQSPTFGLVNEYEDNQGATYYHFDFYRIEEEEEAQDIGVSEYFYSGDICFVEWPSRIPHLIPDKYLLIEIAFSAQDKRQITVTKYD